MINKETKTGITKQGKPSTVLVVSLLDGASEITEARVGDVKWSPDGKSIVIEVKKNTPNQTRPMLYNVLVIHKINDTDEKFFVVPPDEVLKISTKYRGQHTPISAACFNFPMNKETTNKYLVKNGKLGLADAIIAAYNQGENSPLKKIAQECIEEMENLNEKLKKKILSA